MEGVLSEQELKMRETLKYVSENSIYYKQLFHAKAIDVSKIYTLRDLRVIPTIDKDDVSKNNRNFFCVADSEIVDFTTTSGTTGEPLVVPLTENDLQRLALNEETSFKMTGATRDDVFQLMLTLDRQFMAGMAYYLGLRKLEAGCIRVGSVSPKIHWENIFRFKPTGIVCVPSFLLKLIEYAEAEGIDYRTSGIDKALCIGEALRNEDLSDNVLAQRIKDKWPIRLFSTYASTEMQTAFTECEYGKGGHLNPELLIVELLDEDGNEVRSGEIGEVTITTLGVEGMPLVRYRTGDMCKAYHEPCECGRNTMRLSPVIVRKNQMIKFKGTSIFPSGITEVLNSVSEVKDYLVEVTKNELGTDDVVVFYTSSSVAGEETDIRLSELFNTKLRVTPRLQLLSIEELAGRRPENRKLMRVVFK